MKYCGTLCFPHEGVHPMEEALAFDVLLRLEISVFKDWVAKTPIWHSGGHDKVHAGSIAFYCIALLRLSLRPQLFPLSR